MEMASSRSPSSTPEHKACPANVSVPVIAKTSRGLRHKQQGSVRKITSRHGRAILGKVLDPGLATSGVDVQSHAHTYACHSSPPFGPGRSAQR